MDNKGSTQMNETTRTGVFVGGALLSIVLAIAFAPSTPKAPSEFSEVGKSFYENFEALQAKSLKVVSFNEETATSRTFEVEFKDGLWRIPSHHNYPADAKDRLAKTAASVVGIRRDEFKTTNKEDHPDLGVVDPLDEDTTKLKGRGQRITLKDESGKVLADYIIGKQVKGRAGLYYVRRPDEKTVYVVKLNIDLSTKFGDWIETNLLQMGSGQLKDVIVNKYSIDEQRGPVETEVTELSREKSGDPWKLKGMNEEKEELVTADVDTMVRTLEDLRIVGVRPKPAGLSRDLKQAQGIKIDTPTMLDLQSRGFFFTRGGDLVSQEGELLASTSDGVSYVLRFGDVFTSTESQTESGIGLQDKSDGKDPTAKDEKGKADPAQAGKESKPKDDKGEPEKKESEKKEDKKTPGVTENRFVFINVALNPKKLGAKPTKPERPAELKDEKPDEKKKDEAKKPDEKQAEADKAAAAKQAELKKKYDDDVKKYDADLADYNKRLDEGKKKVEELNRRFADWYYVISAESFNKLRLSRKTLVKAKTAAAPAGGAPGLNGLPGLPGLPGVPPKPVMEKKPEATPPASTEPPAGKPATPKAETPAPTKPAVEKPAAGKPEEKSSPPEAKPAAKAPETKPAPPPPPKEESKSPPAPPPAPAKTEGAGTKPADKK